MNYYNEFDPYAAQWLRNLIEAGLIPRGDVDDRSITDVTANDVRGYTQCHLFAGIGGWSFALQLAGWPADRPVWTGSCPCQPFSVANQSAEGLSDERHLWPEYYRLMRALRPSIIFGEQVEKAISWGWWDEVCGDLEREEYTIGATVLPACAAGADHERKRLYWVADATGAGRERYIPKLSVLVCTETPLTQHSHPFVRARRALAGDHSGLLPDYGVSVMLERRRAKGYGNAIVPEAAAEFIKAYMEI